MTMTGYQAKMLKKKTFGSNSGIVLINYSAFLSPFTCLLIGVNQEAEGTALHKEKKTQKQQLKLLQEQKIFPIAGNISSTETLEYCSHSSSSNMVAVNLALISGMLC